MWLLTEEEIFDPTPWPTSTIKWQKLRLSHSHNLIWSFDNIRLVENALISSELSDVAGRAPLRELFGTTTTTRWLLTNQYICEINAMQCNVLKFKYMYKLNIEKDL